MNKSLIALVVLVPLLAGCGSFWKGGGAGAAVGVAGYELNAKHEAEQLKEDHDAGRISQHDYEVRKDQLGKGSIFQ